MNKNFQISELLLQWGEMRDQGQHLTAEELCRDYPELLPEVRRKIEALESIKDWLELPNSGAASTSFPGSETGEQTITQVDTAPVTPKNHDPVTIPGYQIHQTLGRGGMGVVYKAHHQQLDRTVALKMILAGSHASRSDLHRFQTEARSIAKLQHPNIVQIFEVGEHEGKPYLSLEYCAGGSLDRKLKGTPLPPMEAARLVELLAHAMHYAHQENVIHRDLKPANILLVSGGVVSGELSDKTTHHSPLTTHQPKITDFGLAKKLDQETDLTRSDAVMGTPSYMAPEQASGKIRDVGPSVDIYALGAILYECLTGRPPFKAATTMDTLMQVLQEDVVPPRRLQSTLPRDLETICLKCLHKDPKKRYVTAADLAADLQRFQTGKPILARPVRLPERMWRWCRRNPSEASLLAVLAVVIITGFVVLMGLYTLAEESRIQAEKETENALASKKETQKALKKAEDAKKEAEDAQKEEEAEAKKATEVSQFLLSLFEASDPLGLQGYSFGAASGSAHLPVRALLDRASITIKTKLKTQPIIQAAHMDTIGNAYRSLGLYKEAEELLEEGYKIRQQVYDKREHEEIADSQFHLGWLHHERGQYPKARVLYDKSLVMYKKVLPRDSPKITATMFNLAWLLGEMGENEPAEKLFKEIIARRQQQHGTDDHREVAIAKAGLAALYLEMQRFNEALKLSTEALTTIRKLGKDDKLVEAAGLFQEAVGLAYGLKQYSWAEPRLRKCIQLVISELGENHPYLAIATFQLGTVLEGQKKFGEAENYYRQSLKIIRGTIGLAHPKVTVVVEHLARMLNRKGQYDESKALFDEMFAAHEQRFGKDHPLTADVLANYASILDKRDGYQEKARILEKAIGLYLEGEKKFGRKANKLKSAFRNLSLCYRKLKSPEQGLKVGLHRQKVFAGDPKELFDTACELAFLVPLAEASTSLSQSEQKQLAEECISKALQTLDLAAAAGFQDTVLAKVEPRLHAISENKDYLALFEKLPTVDWNKITVHRSQLTAGDPFDKVQKKSRHKKFSHQLQAGKSYQIDLLSADFDSYLRLEDSSGNQLAFNDDVTPPDILDSRLIFAPKQIGDYTIIVTTFRGFQTGNFSLVIQEKE